ncbi:bifunctional phosphatase PAP2/diacylglycerol kinase family protein [Streptantibioticus silvisoli]|uniref:Phosphatase PAP2 family protein n=1 Tax=Streptantibioticus silvisoli TaxID=2705255 RepID=A0ABT6W7N4_9ACTN|nr:bifunctional phosphatase PAP2/diacylglycerol kinase family protein [Streptantibioticus silvisoli]MDI5966762.1 phosphatase PAP2 family protein [Streptantibioticus silvisoli]
MRRLLKWDRQLFGQVAATRWPGADAVLPRLSRAANHGVLWMGAAAALAAAGGKPGRRAALRGLGSLALASAVVNTVGKHAVGRPRPVLDAVPLIRRLHRQPFTTSFPSGHSASAAAFTAGVLLETPAWGLALVPLAAAVAFSRVYTGAHYPSDVLAGVAVGAGAALAVRGLVPERRDTAPPRAEAPALNAGEGLTVVVNTASGVPEILMPAADQLRLLLPKARVLEATEDDDLAALLDEAARAAAEDGGALGVHGGDGTINTAAAAATRHHVPLAVFPGGTRNHLSVDLGIRDLGDTAAAVQAGHAAAIDLATFQGADGEPVLFVNTFSIGAYPELVRVRERWSRRLGSWPASVLAAVHVLRTAEPVEITLGGRPRRIWLLFAGNCAYRSVGLAPLRRTDLADGTLDVRLVDAGPYPRSRLVAAALTGGLGRKGSAGSPVYTAVRRRSLRVGGLHPGTRLAYDGEVAAAPEELTIRKSQRGLVVYRPQR